MGWRERLEEAVMSVFMNILISLAEGTVDFMVTIIGYIHQLTFRVTDIAIVKNAMYYSMGVALTLLAVKVAFDALVIYQLRVSGDPSPDPGEMLIRVGTSVVLILGVPFILGLMFQLNVALIGDIYNLPGMGGDFAEINKLTALLQDASMSYQLTRFMIIVVMIIMAGSVVAIIALFQMAVRAAEWAVIAISGPLMAVGVNSDLFGTWWRHLLTITLSQGIQILMFKLSFYVLVQSWGGVDLLAVVFFVGFLVVTIKSPKILQRYIDATGIGRVAGGAAQQMGSLMLMRKMLRG